MKLPFEGLLKFNNIDMERFGFNSLVPRPGLLTDRPDFIKVDCLIYLRRNGTLLDSSGKLWTFPREEFFNLH